MNFTKVVQSLHNSKGMFTVQEALDSPTRWEAYWKLYSTEESMNVIKTEAEYDLWMRWVGVVRSKPECL